MRKNTNQSIFLAFVVSLGGFLFGFDAGIISGVMSYASPEFDLNEMQTGWVTSSPLFAAMFAMLLAGRLSDSIGRKIILIIVAFLYALSALLSAFATSYEMLYLARMIGGIAFGAALVIAPIYIAEISAAKNRGKLVAIQQLNIILGYFAAFLSNYFFNVAHSSGTSEFLTDQNVWRWMLGVEFFPAILYFILLFLIPKSPRWLYTKNHINEAKTTLIKIHGSEMAKKEEATISSALKKQVEKVKLSALFHPSLRFVLFVGIVIGILQQITGINAVYFYATSIFKQTGIGTDAAFSSGVLLSFTTVVFTVLALFLIDKMGRRPLLLAGILGIAITMLICGFGFQQAHYKLTTESLKGLNIEVSQPLASFVDKTYDNDVTFKRHMKEELGTQVYAKNEGDILEAATHMNATLVLVGILGFIACFAFSLGPVMWVMLSELFPNRYRGLAIGCIGFINGLASWLVSQIFPWELSNLGNALSFYIFGGIALLGFLILTKILPETKGKSLEQIEAEFVEE